MINAFALSTAVTILSRNYAQYIYLFLNSFNRYRRKRAGVMAPDHSQDTSVYVNAVSEAYKKKPTV